MGDTPLDTVMHNLAVELRQVKALLGDVEEHLARVASDDGTQLQTSDLQSLDLIVQTVGELDRFVSALRPALPDGAAVNPADAVTSIRLEALARRMNSDAPNRELRLTFQTDAAVDLF